MIFSRKKEILFLLLILPGTACNTIVNNSSSANESFWKFEYEYTNEAWGYVLKGTVIDANGDIYFYDYAGSNDRFEPADPDYLTYMELSDKFSHLPQFFRNISSDVVMRMDSLVANSAMGGLSDPVSIGNDMGTYRWNYYFYDANREKYHRILLKEWGDWERENTSPAAQAVLEWLEMLEITQLIRKN